MTFFSTHTSTPRETKEPNLLETQPIRNLIFSFVRTWAPIVVGGVLSWLAVHAKLVVDEQTKAGLVILFTGLFQGVYYFAARMLETYVSPKFSFMVADVRKGDSAPIYPDPTETTVVPAAVAPEVPQ